VSFGRIKYRLRCCRQKGAFNEFPIQPGNIGDGDFFGALCLAFSFVRTIPEAQLIHSFHHIDCALGGFGFALGQ
jgi:hypothetical protein